MKTEEIFLVYEKEKKRTAWNAVLEKILHLSYKYTS